MATFIGRVPLSAGGDMIPLKTITYEVHSTDDILNTEYMRKLSFQENPGFIKICYMKVEQSNSWFSKIRNTTNQIIIILLYTNPCNDAIERLVIGRLFNLDFELKLNILQEKD